MLLYRTGPQVFNPRHWQIHHLLPGIFSCRNPPLARPCNASKSLQPLCERRRWLPSAQNLLQLGYGDSNQAWLTPALRPHPSVELIKPDQISGF